MTMSLSQVVSVIQSFFQAMALNRSIQQRAQKELDEVIGPDRLPTFEDRTLLPYTEAIVRETIIGGKVLAPLLRGGVNLSQSGHTSLHDAW